MYSRTFFSLRIMQTRNLQLNLYLPVNHNVHMFYMPIIYPLLYNKLLQTLVALNDIYYHSQHLLFLPVRNSEVFQLDGSGSGILMKLSPLLTGQQPCEDLTEAGRCSWLQSWSNQDAPIRLAHSPDWQVDTGCWLLVQFLGFLSKKLLE